MKKKWTVIILSSLAIGVLFIGIGFPALVGGRLQAFYDDFIVKVRSYKDVVTVDSYDYDRGVFSSSVAFVFHIKPNQVAVTPGAAPWNFPETKIKVEQQISHFFSKIKWRLYLNDEEIPIKVKSKVNIFREVIENTASLEYYKASSFEIKDLKLGLDLSSYSLVELLSVSFEELIVQESTTKGDDHPEIKVEDFSLSLDPASNGSLQHYFLKGKLPKLHWGDIVYGPGKLEFDILNFDRDAIQKIKKTAIKLGEAQAKLSGNNQQANPMAQMDLVMEVMGIIPEFLKHSPEINLRKLVYKMPGEKDLKGHAWIHYSPDQKKENDIDQALMMTFALKEGVEAEIDFQFPKSVIASPLDFIQRLSAMRENTKLFEEAKNRQNETILKQLDQDIRKNVEDTITKLKDQGILKEHNGGEFLELYLHYDKNGTRFNRL